MANLRKYAVTLGFVGPDGVLVLVTVHTGLHVLPSEAIAEAKFTVKKEMGVAEDQLTLKSIMVEIGNA